MSEPKGPPKKGQGAIWPMPRFYFKVTWGETTLSFSEVSGLDTEAQIIEYRHGDDWNSHNPIKMPGLQEFKKVTMKRGVFVGGPNFYDWFSEVKLNTINQGRENITVELLNEKGKATIMWTLCNAWPTKITSTDQKSDGNEGAIDTLEIAYEMLEIKNMDPA